MNTTERKKASRIEAARQTAGIHLAIENPVFNGSYPHPTHGYEVFSFTNATTGQCAKIALQEIVLSLHY
jgi:hypothetical protein